MIRKSKFLDVFILMFIAVLFLSIMQVVMTPMDTTTLVARVLGVCSVSMILYLLASKMGFKIHINNKVKIISASMISMFLIVLSILNLSQIHNDIGRLERDKYIHLWNFGIDKYHLASIVVLFVFPLFSSLVTDILQKRDKGALISGILLLFTQLFIIMDLCGLRLASVVIVTVINTVVTCYALKSKFKISKQKLLYIIVGLGFILITVFFIYNSLYPKTTEISIRHFWKIIPFEMRESLVKNSKFIGMNTGNEIYRPDVFYDSFNPFLVMILEFGWGAYVIMLFLSIVMVCLILKIARIICKSNIGNIKKIIAIALTSHILLQIVMSILISLGLPAIPIHFPFYIQEGIFNYHFRYTTSGYADIAILTCLLMMYLETLKKNVKEVDEQTKIQMESEVETNEVVCV